MNRFFVRVLLLTGVLIATGCSSSGGGSSSSEVAGEITYAVWDANQVPALEQNIADFNELYPEVEVTLNVTPFAQYWTKLQTQAEGGQLPDVFWMNGPNFELYASNGFLEPLAGLLDDGSLDLADYPDVVTDSYMWEGELYGVPKDYTTIALFYNADIFERAGVSLPTGEWTLDDFHEAASAISTALVDDGIYGASVSLGGQESYYNTIFQSGGFVISDDRTQSGYGEPEAIEGLKFWADLVGDGSIPGPAQLADTPATQWFASGKSAMLWTGTWNVPQLAASPIRDAINLTDIPKGTHRATNVLGLANVVSTDSANMSASRAFVAYLGGEEAQRVQGELGVANPAHVEAGDSFVGSIPEWNLEVFVTSVEYARPYPVSFNTSAWTRYQSELLPQAFSGERPVADVAQELADAMNKALAAEQS